MDSHLAVLVSQILGAIYKMRLKLGPAIAQEAEPTNRGKRQSLLELEIYNLLLKLLPRGLKRLSLKVRLNVEGWDPVILGKGDEINFDIWVDAVDGTASAARWIDSGVFTHGLPINTVVSISHAVDQPTFNDFFIGAAVDLHSGQQWIADLAYGAWTRKKHRSPEWTNLGGRRNYHRHNPRLACEFYRHANWATRLLVNQPVEWTDMNILLAVMGETDCFFNNVTPWLSNEGQRGHELGAIYVFVRKLGAYAIDTRTGEDLGKSAFTFDGMTPVIVGVDAATVRYYWDIVNDNLKKITGGNQVLIDLHNAVGTERWLLRPLSKMEE